MEDLGLITALGGRWESIRNLVQINQFRIVIYAFPINLAVCGSPFGSESITEKCKL